MGEKTVYHPPLGVEAVQEFQEFQEFQSSKGKFNRLCVHNEKTDSAYSYLSSIKTIITVPTDEFSTLIEPATTTTTGKSFSATIGFGHVQSVCTFDTSRAAILTHRLCFSAAFDWSYQYYLGRCICENLL